MSHSRHVTLSCVYSDTNTHITALLVHSKNCSWGTQTKNTVKDKCGISLAIDTSADAVFCFVPAHYSKTPSAFLQLVLLNACARRGCALWPCCQHEQSREKSFYRGREEHELGALSCSAKVMSPWTLLH